MLCGHASNTTEDRGAAVVPASSEPASLPFLTRPPFSDTKIYKGVHRVHFVTCVHKQSVSFPFETRGLSEKGGKHFCRHNVHKRSQTPSVPAKNRHCMVGFFFPSVIWNSVYCTWKNRCSYRGRKHYMLKSRVVHGTNFANPYPLVIMI